MTIKIIPKPLFILLLFPVLLVGFEMSDSTSTVLSTSIQDSILISTEPDSVWLRSTYSVDIPRYEPIPDSLRQTRSAPERSTPNDLRAKGSISRGIQVSTNASVSLQSSMYLKVDGQLGERYRVSGTLSEKTSPLQPIGNTRRLNDFDRVLISITGPTLTAEIGDIEIRENRSRLSRLERNIEGLQFKTAHSNWGVHGALGFSYGERHRQEIQGLDGKQGPYRLAGANGEKYIILLAGTERIRLDDRLLTRGEQEDYIIDYNAAEVQFTQKNLISSVNRISVDFEYVPDIYLSSYTFGKQLISTGGRIGSDDSPVQVAVNYQTIFDDTGNPLGQTGGEDIEALFSSLPDTVGQIWVDDVAIDSTGGDYILNDEGILIFLGPGLGDRRPVFTFVGLEQGQYRKVQDLSGIYYVFDEALGEYRIGKVYAAPGSHRVLTVDTWIKQGIFRFNSELGLSNMTNNLYSTASTTEERLAWEIETGLEGQTLGLIVTDRQFSAGFTSHAPLEDLEMYRRWQVTPRLNEQERLSRGSLRIGDETKDHVGLDISEFERSQVTRGDRLAFRTGTDASRSLSMAASASQTDLDTLTRRELGLSGTFDMERVRVKLFFEGEEGSFSSYYLPNDHFVSGLEATMDNILSGRLTLLATERRDFKTSQKTGSLFDHRNSSDWDVKRQDLGLGYQFNDLLATKGAMRFKYRQQLSDTLGEQTYFLGQYKGTTSLLDDRLSLRQETSMDEEHIPRFDYHYVEVDTGYGQFSYDPFIKDYIPVNGGRYVRMRLFSDVEEQVRTWENKSRVQWQTQTYSGSKGKGLRSRLDYNAEREVKVSDEQPVNEREMLRTELNFKNTPQASLSELSLRSRSTRSASALYNYGSEENQFDQLTIEGIAQWDPANKSVFKIDIEDREREVEYNPLAKEEWLANRAGATHFYQHSPQQRVEFGYAYSQVADQRIDQNYAEHLIKAKHELRFGKRGRLNQELELSLIQADADAIPYSIFSGRQPGQNWKYGFQARYIFSSLFQINGNYSIRQRGEGDTEQYLRLEGRTHF